MSIDFGFVKIRTGIMNFVLCIGIAYGVAAFLSGLAASFTLNSRDIVESVLLLFCGFLAILPIAILAIWKPKISVILDRKSTRLNSSHLGISYAVFCLK